MRSSILVIICSMLLFSSTSARPNRNSFECFDDYEGIGRAQDFKKAYECFKRYDDKTMLIIMELNGEGRRPNLKLARKYLEQMGNVYPSGRLENFISEREYAQPGQKFARIDYCQSIATSTPEIDFCADMRMRKEDIKNKATLENLKRSISTSDRNLLERIISDHERYVKDDVQRVQDQYWDGGTIVGLQTIGHSRVLNEYFIEHLTNISESHLDMSEKDKEYKSADQKLNKIFQDQVKGLKNKKVETDYRKAERDWLAYRDDMAEFAASHLKAKFNQQLARTSVKTILTRERTEILLGPHK